MAVSDQGDAPPPPGTMSFTIVGTVSAMAGDSPRATTGEERDGTSGPTVAVRGPDSISLIVSHRHPDARQKSATEERSAAPRWALRLRTSSPG